MRVGIDLFPLVPAVGRGGGFHRYATELVRALAADPGDHTYVLFVNRLNAGMFPRGGRLEHVVVPVPPQRAVWPFRLLWQHALLPLVARAKRLDLVHFPFDTASVLIRRPFVVTIHDLIADRWYPTHAPGAVSGLKAWYLRSAKRRAALRARAVLCPSVAAAREVVAEYGVGDGTVRVTPEAVGDEFRAPRRDRAPRAAPGGAPYVLTVASLSPHKNIVTAVRAFARARERHALPHELRVVGMHGLGASGVSDMLRDEARRGVPVRYMGFVPDEELPALYAGADLFVFLSHVEGFGLPPLEAMASGVPVVASDASSIPEVCGDAAVLVPPDDIERAAAAIGELLRDRGRAARLVEAGYRRAARFTWAETARLTREAYEEAARPRPAAAAAPTQP